MSLPRRWVPFEFPGIKYDTKNRWNIHPLTNGPSGRAFSSSYRQTWLDRVNALCVLHHTITMLLTFWVCPVPRCRIVFAFWIWAFCVLKENVFAFGELRCASYPTSSEHFLFYFKLPNHSWNFLQSTMGAIPMNWIFPSRILPNDNRVANPKMAAKVICRKKHPSPPKVCLRWADRTDNPDLRKRVGTW